MSATGAKVSPYAAPATDKDESASAKLMEAKRAGHQVRMRISGTAGGVGGVLVVFCVIALVTGRRGGDLAYAGVTCGYWGMLGLLLALLPTDRKAIYRVLVFMSVMGLIGIFGTVSYAMLDMPNADIGRACRDEHSHGYCNLMLVCSWLQVVVVASIPCFGVYGYSKQPRDALAALWKLSGFFFLGLGSVRTVSGIAPYVVGARQRLGAEIWGWYSLVLLISLGCLMLWPSFRVRAQAALMSRGGQISSAAGVAALLGDHSIDVIKATSKEKFYGINVSRVTFEHIEYNKPDPALFELAEKAMFDGVDWFISHSWRDNASAKFRAIQTARTNFVAKNKREPIAWCFARRGCP